MGVFRTRQYFIQWMVLAIECFLGAVSKHLFEIVQAARIHRIPAGIHSGSAEGVDTTFAAKPMARFF